MNRRSFLRVVGSSALACALPSAGQSASEGRASKPNVLFIAIDDLNDWIEPLGGHPQAKTPIYGALMGRTTEQIDGLIEEIQSFAELDHHFDRPIRTYSSGMKSRLGISVATAFKPDLLLIDEVLGVGDASFRKKSEKRVKDMISESGTVVIVSHSLGMLKKICDKIVWVDQGCIKKIGKPEAILQQYNQETTGTE